jgi:hypothetical protein
MNLARYVGNVDTSALFAAIFCACFKVILQLRELLPRGLLL